MINLNKLFISLIVFGLFLRFFLSYFTFHPDIRAFQYGGQIVGLGNVLNLYDYIANLPDDDLIVQTLRKDLFIYPPSIYIYHGIFNFIFSSIGLNVINEFIIENKETFYNSNFNLHLFLLKIPYLIFDFLFLFILYKLFDNKRDRIAASLLWWFNPINLYATYMLGQFDIIPTFFTVLALYYVRYNQLYFAAFSLGWGIAFKIYPLLLLPFLIFSVKSFYKRLLLFMLGVSVYVITIFPYMFSEGFRSSALLAGQTLKSFYAQIPISGGESLILYLIGLIFLYLVTYRKEQKDNDIWKSFFMVLLLFFSFTHYHPQWFLWITPFFIYELIESRFKNLLVVIVSLISFFGLIMLFHPSLNYGLFAPLFPMLYEGKDIWSLLNIDIDLALSRSVFQSIFAAGSLYYLYIYFPRRVNES